MKPKTKRAPKRKTRAERQIDESNRVAMLITSAPIVGSTMAAPGLVRDPRLAPAMALWREVVPMLEARRVLDASDRFQLAMLCYFWCEFVFAADDALARAAKVQEPADDELKLAGRHGDTDVADWNEIEPRKAN